MARKIQLRKTCSIYADDLHFATMVFPFIEKEINNNTTIKTILEKNEEENIEKIINNIGLNSEIKEKIKQIDWSNTNIKKIRNNFEVLKQDIKEKNNIDIIVLGKNLFVQKVNKAIDLWFKNNIEELENIEIQINVINCFSFEENKKIYKVKDSYDYILKTSGIEEIFDTEELLKAN